MIAQRYDLAETISYQVMVPDALRRARGNVEKRGTEAPSKTIIEAPRAERIAK